MNSENVLIPVDFEDLDDWLLSLGSDFPAAELHGALVGGLAGSMRLSLNDWGAFGIAIMGGEEQLLSDRAVCRVLGGLAQEQLELLAGEELSFVPFLPDDDIEISLRVEALSLWCKGFLGGFAEAQVHQANAEGSDIQNMVEDLPPNVAEALQDMTAIAQVAYEAAEEDAFGDEDELLEDTFDDEPAAMPDAEYDERDYCELVEYLRLAALTVFTEYGWVEVQDAEQAKKVRSALDAAISLENTTGRTLH